MELEILHYVKYVSCPARGTDEQIKAVVRKAYPRDDIKKIERRSNTMIFRVESPIHKDV